MPSRPDVSLSHKQESELRRQYEHDRADEKRPHHRPRRSATINGFAISANDKHHRGKVDFPVLGQRQPALNQQHWNDNKHCHQHRMQDENADVEAKQLRGRTDGPVRCMLLVGWRSTAVAGAAGTTQNNTPIAITTSTPVSANRPAYPNQSGKATAPEPTSRQMSARPIRRPTPSPWSDVLRGC